MIKPAIDDILRSGHNRYTMVVATAKCARIVNDEILEQYEQAQIAADSRDGGSRPMPSMMRREIVDEKPVILAVDRIMRGEYRIVTGEDVE